MISIWRNEKEKIQMICQIYYKILFEEMFSSNEKPIEYNRQLSVEQNFPLKIVIEIVLMSNDIDRRFR